MPRFAQKWLGCPELPRITRGKWKPCNPRNHCYMATCIEPNPNYQETKCCGKLLSFQCRHSVPCCPAILIPLKKCCPFSHSYTFCWASEAAPLLQFCLLSCLQLFMGGRRHCPPCPAKPNTLSEAIGKKTGREVVEQSPAQNQWFPINSRQKSSQTV